jgi:hypothetical protein
MSKTKTIEVSEEMYAKLIELATEMTTQDPRCTRMPHLFQIRDWKRNYDWDLNGNTPCWVDSNGDYTVVETLDDLKDYLDHNGVDEPDNLDELWDDAYDLRDWIEDNCGDLKECSYSMEPVYTNSFLTAKAAQEHLDRNDYHYHKDADVYLHHAWRNSEADLISEFLCGLVDKKMHT